MSDLAVCISYMDDTRKDLDLLIGKLEKLQRYFSDNFENVVRIRNDEFEFLQDAFFRSDPAFPQEIKEIFRAELPVQQAEYEKNYDELKGNVDDLAKRLKKVDSQRISLLDTFKRFNQDLDRREENLKTKIYALEEKISSYNRKIDELNRGIGFIINLFNMKRLQKEKERYLKARKKMVEEIEDIRKRWKDKEGEITKELEGLKESWNNPQTEFSLISEKLKYLEENKHELIQKTAFSETLKKLKGSEVFLLKLIQSDRPEKIMSCPRCRSDNKNNIFFCFYCGERFSENRPDIEGSLVEVGELNEVYESLLEGIKESVSFLALLKGIKTGIDAIRKSYASVKKSQDTYSSLKKLKISIPEVSKQIPYLINKLNGSITLEFKNLHPKAYFEPYKAFIQDYFAEENIKIFFEAMGEELNKTTKAQW